MAKANLVLPDGTTVAIEGTADEVAVLLNKFSPSSATQPATPKKKKRRHTSNTAMGSGTKRKKKDGPQGLIAQLAKEGYFKSKRTISDIQKKLEELGHLYAMHSISTPLTRLTKNRTLRRLKENKVWVYVS